MNDELENKVLETLSLLEPMSFEQIILDFEKEFAANMADERARAAVRRDQDKFLMDPMKMMARAKAGPPTRRFDEVLPGYLTASLFEMGIYDMG